MQSLSLVYEGAFNLAVFLVGRLWKDWVRPAIENLWYSGTRLAPQYHGEFTFGGKTGHDFVEVHQRAKKVWGSMTIPEGRGDAKFEFEATLNRDNVLRGTYHGVNEPAYGSFLLTRVTGTSDFEGGFIQPYNRTVVCGEYKWASQRSSPTTSV